LARAAGRSPILRADGLWSHAIARPTRAWLLSRSARSKARAAALWRPCAPAARIGRCARMLVCPVWGLRSMMTKTSLVATAGVTLVLGAAAAPIGDDVASRRTPASAPTTPLSDEGSIVVSLRIAQAGNVGGTLGKSDQSLSGDRRKEPPAARGPRRPSFSLSGQWQWTQNCQIGGTFRGTFRISQSTAGRFGGSFYQEAPKSPGRISEGVIDGNRISFTVTLTEPNVRVEKWNGTLSGGNMHGTAISQNVGSCTFRASRG
jgi:hypothetical protein